MAADDRRRVEIRLLGPVEVTVDGVPLVVDTRKAVALLAFAATAVGAVPRTRLATLLWPDADEERANGALRRTLSVLRAGLGGRALAINRAVVELHADEIAVDLQRFRRAVERTRNHAHSAAESCESCRSALAEAVALVRGPFMDSFGLRDNEVFDDWLTTEGEYVRGEIVAALERLAHADLAAGDFGGALEVGRRWLAMDELHEPAHRLLIRAHAAAGEFAAAVAQYRACVRVLDAELGVAPLPETTALYESIRHGSRPIPGTGIGAEPRAINGAGPLAAGSVAAGSVASSTRATSAPPAPDGLRDPRAPSPTRERSPIGAPPLIGRDQERALLVTGWESAVPDGHLLVVQGEAGIGKTRLLDALVEDVTAAGGRIVRVACHVGERQLPAAGVSTLLRSAVSDPEALDRLRALPPSLQVEAARLVPALSTGLTATAADPWVMDPTARTRLFEALIDVLGEVLAGLRPALVVVEDLQWADDTTAQFVAFLARRLTGRPLALALSWRPGESDDVSERFALEAERIADLRIILPRLSARDSATLARTIAPDLDETNVARVTEESEGLPLYVVAALAMGGLLPDATPAGVAALQRERLAAVTETSRQVVTAAAVLGRSFDLGTVRGVSGRSDDEVVGALDELGRLGILRELPAARNDAIAYDFTHGSLRDVAYADASMARRRLLHRRAAESLRSSTRATGAVEWSLIAGHELAGGRDAEAADAFIRSGDAAREVFAHREAIDAYGNALALGSPRAATLHLAIGELQAAFGEYAAAVGSLEAAAAAIAGDPDENTRPAAAEVDHQLGRLHAFRGNLSAAASHFRSALDAVGPTSSATRSRLLAELAGVELRMDGPDAATPIAEEGLAMAGEVGDDIGAMHALRVLGMADAAAARFVAGHGHLEDSLRAADRTGDGPGRIAAHNALAVLEFDEGRYDEALEHALAALDAAHRAGYRHVEAAIESSVADILHAAGRDDEAREHQRRSVLLFADVADAVGGLEPELWKLVIW